jgi:hypothetical protein
MENRYRWPTNPMSTSDEAQAMMRIERNLSDDNDRLRAALTLIAGAKDVRGCDEIARQALAGSPVETSREPRGPCPKCGADIYLAHPHMCSESSRPPELLHEFERRCKVIGEAAALMDLGKVHEARYLLGTCIGSQQETKAFTPDEHSPACATRRFGEKECDCGVAEKTDLVNQLKAKGDQTTPRIDRQVRGAAGEDS